MDNKSLIKSLLALNAMTIKTLAIKMTEKSKRKYTYESLRGKLNRNTITLAEAQVIADILGYEVKFVEK